MMKENIHYFGRGEYVEEQATLEKIGVRGRSAMELASLDLPILPGFIFDADTASDLENLSLREDLESCFSKIESTTGKKFGDEENPMLVK